MAKKLNQVSEDYRKIKKWTEKDPVNYFIVIILIFIFILFLINLPGIYTVVMGVSEKFKMDSIPAISIPTDIPTPSPTETPAPTEAPIYIAPTRDPDPPVLCNVSPNCGGGTTPLRQSECNNSTCCQIGDKWIFYKDKVQCGRDQASQERSSAPVINNVQQSGNNVYCWNNVSGYGYYTSSGDQCNLDNIKATTYKICQDTQKMKVDSCDSSCSGLSLGINGGEDLYAECLKKCGDQFSIDLTQCHL